MHPLLVQLQNLDLRSRRTQKSTPRGFELRGPNSSEKMSSFTSCLLLLITFAGASLYALLTLDLQWEMYDLKSIILCNESYNIDARILHYFRLCNFMLMLYTVYHQLCDKEGIYLKILQRGKLRSERIRGMQRFTMFTVWSWNLQLLYFGLSSYLTFIDGGNENFIRLCVVLYELSFSLAFLVTIITTFILLPTQLERGIPVDNFFRPMCMNSFLSCLHSLLFFSLLPCIDLIIIHHATSIFSYSFTYAQFQCLQCQHRNDLQ